MWTSSKRKEQEIGTQKKTLTFGDPDRKLGEIEQNLNLEQKSLSVEKHVQESWRVQEKKRHKNPGSRVLKEMAVFGKKTWRIKFCPGSLDG